MEPTTKIIESPLLLLVQAKVVLQHENAFNAWYYNHIPTLLQIPGYRWGRRYQAVDGDGEYLTLCEIEDETFLETLIGPDADKRHAIANQEFARWQQLEGLSDVRINVYQHLSGSHLSNPFLKIALRSILSVACVTVAETVAAPPSTLENALSR